MAYIETVYDLGLCDRCMPFITLSSHLRAVSYVYSIDSSVPSSVHPPSDEKYSIP